MLLSESRYLIVDPYVNNLKFTVHDEYGTFVKEYIIKKNLLTIVSQFPHNRSEFIIGKIYEVKHSDFFDSFIMNENGGIYQLSFLSDDTKFFRIITKQEVRKLKLKNLNK